MRKPINTLESFILREFSGDEDKNKPFTIIDGQFIDRITISEHQLDSIEWGVVTTANMWNILCMTVAVTQPHGEPEDLALLYRSDIERIRNSNPAMSGHELYSEIKDVMR